MEHDNTKIKFICRMQNGQYSEQLLTDGIPQEEAQRSAEQYAQIFLHAFSPEALAKALAAQYGDGSPVVFRTDAAQMEEFRALLLEHQASGE